MFAEDDDYDLSHAVRTAPRPQARVSAFGPNALVVLGLALVAGGGAGLLSRHVSWTVHQLANRVAAHGVSFDVVCAAGLVLLAAGMVGRSFTRLSRRVGSVSDAHSDLALALDQVLAEVADVRSGIDQILSQPEPRNDRPAPAEDLRGQNDKEALFRMAASLDQLGGRLSQRVATDLGALKAELTRLVSGTQRLAARVGALESVRQPAPPPLPAARPAAPPAPPPAARPVAQPAAARRPSAQPAAGVPARPVVRETATRPEHAEEPRRDAARPVPAQPIQPARGHLVGAEQAPPADPGDAVVVDLDAEESGLELLERLEEEVEGETIHLYDPPAALPGPAPAADVRPRSYESAARPPEAR